MSPCTPPIVRIIFSFCSFEISGYILRNLKMIIGYPTVNIGPIWIILTALLNGEKTVILFLAPCCQIPRVTSRLK